MTDNSGKIDRFKRLATKRTNAVLERLSILGNCANKSAYDYDAADVDKIFSTIEKQVKKTKAKFEAEIEEKNFKL